MCKPNFELENELSQTLMMAFLHNEKLNKLDLTPLEWKRFLLDQDAEVTGGIYAPDLDERRNDVENGEPQSIPSSPLVSPTQFLTEVTEPSEMSARLYSSPSSSSAASPFAFLASGCSELSVEGVT